MRIVNIVGARPNFMKIAPLMEAYRAHPAIEALLVHTGQHYDAAMSEQFFTDLDIAPPDHNLGIGGGSHASQHARVIAAFDDVLTQTRPDIVVVVGDVNSTLSCALAAAKRNVPVAHVEAGLRSFERTMPEEMNRVLTDHLSDLLFVSEESGLANLAREGLDHAGVHFSGNVMIDSLRRNLQRSTSSSLLDRLQLSAGGYAALTLHRPSNVDDPACLERLIGAIVELSSQIPIVFPAHPRTLARLGSTGLGDRLKARDASGVRLVEPLGYLDFLHLVRHARLMLTDSGGIQEETTALKIPCVTLRSTTERPATVWAGSNRLVGADPDRIREAFDWAMSFDRETASIPARWDGLAARRIASTLSGWSSTGRAHRLRPASADLASLAGLG